MVDDVVSCGERMRGVHIDDADFESLAEEEKGSLVCRICERVRERFKLLEGECAARVEEVKQELEIEREKRVVLGTQVEVLAKREELKVQFQKLISEWERKVGCMGAGELSKEREKRVELERQVEELKKGKTLKVRLDQCKGECGDRVESMGSELYSCM